VPNNLNVLLIFTDQHTQSVLGCYGNRVVKTPNLDALAEESVLFRNAVVAQPVCTPARASLLTGTYGHTHGCVKNNMVLTTEVPTAAEILAPIGYRCGYIGKWHIGNEILPQRGFGEFWRSTEDNYMSNVARADNRLFSTYHHWLRARGFEPESKEPWGYFTRMEAARLPEEAGKPAYTAYEAKRFFESLDERPFFLAVNFLEPHPPYFSPWDDMYSADEVGLPENFEVDEEQKAGWSKRHEAFWRFYYERGHNCRTSDVDDVLGMRRRYYGLTSLADKYIGKILEALAQSEHRDDTVVVFTSDHGDMLGAHQMVDKGMMFEEAIKVPLLLRHPDGSFAGSECDAMVNNVDVLPTLLDLVDAPVPDSVQGRSILPELCGNPGAVPDFAVVEWNGLLQNMHARDPRFAEVLNAHVRCVVTKRWKLILSPGDRSELYDLENDPFERRNVFDRPENKPVVSELYANLRRWQEETQDDLVVPDPLASVE